MWYSKRKRCAIEAIEYKTRERLVQNVSREGVEYLPCPELGHHQMTYNQISKLSECDAAHIVPANNNRVTAEDMQDTISYANLWVVRDCINKGLWRAVESIVPRVLLRERSA